jgi:hypothetical protein
MNTEIRELSVDEMTMVSGAERPSHIIELRLPGQVYIQLNTRDGLFAVFCGGKPIATEQGPA